MLVKLAKDRIWTVGAIAFTAWSWSHQGRTEGGGYQVGARDTLVMVHLIEGPHHSGNDECRVVPLINVVTLI